MSKLGIVCAMREEVQKIVAALDLAPSDPILGYNTFDSADIVLIESSIGKVASAIATAALIEECQVERIINIGLAGALSSIEAGQAFFIRSVTQHDAYIPFEAYQQDLYQRLDCSHPANEATATLTTGDQFITDTSAIDDRADMVDMEGFAVAYTAKRYQVPTTLIKGISDDANSHSEQELFDNLNLAMDKTIELLKKVV